VTNRIHVLRLVKVLAMIVLLMSGTIELCRAQSINGIRSLRVLAAERAMVAKKAATTSVAKESQTIRYSGSAQAGNMVVPAILLGFPSIVILALIIRAMKRD
jgi:hypothetical protein